MKKQAGMSWIEALMVIAVLGIISAVAVPKLVGLSSSVSERAKSDAVAAVKSAFASAIQQQQRFPDIVELSEYVDAEAVKPAANGIHLRVHGENYTVLTYAGIECQSADRTGSVTDTVRCVGDIVKN